MSEAMDIQELNDKVQKLLPDLRKELGEDAQSVSDEHLLKFLRWKTDVKRAAQRFHAHLDWKRRNPGLFDETLRVSQDAELERLLKCEVVVAPPQSKTRIGGPVIVGRLRNNDMTDGRTTRDVCRSLFYTLDRVLENPLAQSHGVTIVHDLRGFDRSKNVHLDIPRTLLGGIIGHFPIKIRNIYLMDAPWGFKALFSFVSTMLFPRKLKERCHFVDDKGDVYKDVEKSMLLTELGGEVQFDVSEWIQQQKERELGGAFSTLTDMISSS
eukprot:Nitzschia sp. Nitz4//scaffold226_size53432//13656//14459//NITZ4_006694-RA/size53432-processed-gene-0.15-mRNA-1//1//CDS//3329542730//5752//frame0